jgi:hypothetical protein
MLLPFSQIALDNLSESGLMYLQMRTRWILGILIIAILLVTCCLWILRPGDNPENRGLATRGKPKLPAHLPLTVVRRQGSVTIARLQSPAQIDGFPCAAGYVHFSETGHLQAASLGETCTVQDHEIPKGTWVRLNSDLTLKFCSFPQNTAIQGYLCRGGPGGSEGVSTGFYPSGRLQSFFPPEDIEIQGVPCRATPFGPVYLHENGELKELTLARDTMIGGRALDEGQSVVLNERGEVQSVSNPSLIERARSWFKKIFR